MSSKSQAGAPMPTHWRSDHQVLADELEQLHGVKAPPPSAHADESADPQQARRLFAAIHGLPPDDERAALCLSGGGIRSATFSLGVLQGLAQQGQLRRFHYLSTVSGGGYIGSWLTAWFQREQQRLGAGATADDARESVIGTLAAVGAGQVVEPPPLQRLRAYSNYLSPVRGLSADFLTLLAIYLRNLALNWMVLLPVLVAVLLLPRLHLAVLQAAPSSDWVLVLVAVAAVLCVGLTIAFMASDLPAPASRDPDADAPPQDLRQPPASEFTIGATVPLVLAAVLLAWLGAWLSVSSPDGPAAPALQTWRTWLLDRDDSWRAPLWFVAGGAVLHGVAGLLGGHLLRPWRNAVAGQRQATWPVMLAVLLSGAVGGVLLWWLLSLAIQNGAALQAGMGWYATLALPCLLMVFWAGLTALIALSRRFGTEDDREWWARAAGSWLGVGVVWFLLALLVIQLPVWLLSIEWLQTPAGAKTAGAGAAALGVLTSVAGYLSKQGPVLKKRAEGLASALGLRLLDLAAAVFILALLVALNLGVSSMLQRLDPEVAARTLAADTVAYGRACQGLKAEAKQAVDVCADARLNPVTQAQAHYGLALQHAVAQWPLLGIALLVTISVIVSWLIGTNTFSLHGLYGNRLVRAYLAASRSAGGRRPHWFTGFDPADNLAMAAVDPGAVKPGASPRSKPLFPVINVALNMVAASGKRLEWQQRKAAPFTISPTFCGSPETGYVRSTHYVGGISLGRALTLSGAAASPNMGYNSSPLVTFVMTLFNVRLGGWLPNTGQGHEAAWARGEPPTSTGTLWDEALGRTSSETPFVYLSDGGHFENLGLYEMVRRRCRHIVLVDAGCDPDYLFGDLENAIRKIRIDLGIEICFPDGLPGPAADGRPARHLALGCIQYDRADAEAPPGMLYLIKPVLTGDEPFDVQRYAAATKQRPPAFPQQSTGDQFFDETQFESYRMLGLHSVRNSFPRRGHWPISTASSPLSGAAASSADGGVAGAGGLDDDLATGAAQLHEAVRVPASNLLRDMGGAVAGAARGATAAAALAVGGALGVTGAVSLSNSELTLKDPEGVMSRVQARLSEQSINDMAAAVASAVRASGAGAGVPDLQPLLQAVQQASAALAGQDSTPASLREALLALSGQVEQLTGKAAPLPGQLAGLGTQAEAVATRLAAFNDALSTTALHQMDTAARQVAGAASAMQVAAKALQDAAGRPLQLTVEQAAAVASAASDIRDIKTAVEKLPPRLPVRGTSIDGGRP
ncbi:MAG: hypothetical protein A3E25_17805 [Burkholderiales bacterium RIFCSPHIGHO2_12_FULL_69_20]|nr:MAG: hypothetical protein A3E25_17805 [Burkholderiales bacterium RIFCSPHIGHO2_12_FULL_69_20]